MTEVLANTDMIMKMLEYGITPRLPSVVASEALLSLYPDFVSPEGDANDIVAVEYDCDEEVQCIAIDDDEHLYITDDFIPTHNTSNIVFLKSTDDSMIDTLQKMSGTTHRAYKNSKNVTRNVKSLFKPLSNEAMVGYTIAVVEEPVIKYNDMAFISERNSIVFRAGDAPIWNRNQTILPMSWRLFQNTIKQPGKDYTLQTIPTCSTAIDFDVRKNQPNFSKMLEKRMEQAYVAQEAQEKYREAYGYTDYDIEQLDPDTYADEIMDLICSTLNPQELKDAIENSSSGKKDDGLSNEDYEEMLDYMFGNKSSKSSKFTVEQDIYNEFDNIEDNKEIADEVAKFENEQRVANVMRYARKTISRDMLVSKTGCNHGLDAAIIKVYQDIRGRMEHDTQYFTVNGGNLCGKGGEVYIKNTMTDNDRKLLSDASKDQSTRIFAEDEDMFEEGREGEYKTDNDMGSYTVTDDFLRFLVSFPKAWPFADGEFELRMASEMKGE